MDKKRNNVLIIDDDEFFREFYRSELSQHDLLVEFAKDGEEGLEKAFKIKPDIILLDIILPKRDGFEVLKDLKKNKSTKNIPVIITSTLGNNADIKKLFEMGAINNFNKTNTLPKDIALYVKKVLTHDLKNDQSSFGQGLDKDSQTPIKVPKERAKAIFKEAMQEVEKKLNDLLGSKITKSDESISSLTFSDVKKEIGEVSKYAGIVSICSEIQTTKPSLFILSIKRDEALSLIKLLEQGLIGDYLSPEDNNKLLESFLNIHLTAFINKIAALSSVTFLTKPPKVISSQELLDYFTDLNFIEDDMVSLIKVNYFAESANVLFSFLVFLADDALTKDAD